MDEKIIGKCIKCGGNVTEKEKYYVCEHRKAIKDENGNWHTEGCDFIVFKDTFRRFGKNKLTVKEMKKFLKEKEVVLELVSKNGNNYTKYAVFDEKWNIKIDFDTNVENVKKEEPVKEEENLTESAEDTLTFHI